MRPSLSIIGAACGVLLSSGAACGTRDAPVSRAPRLVPFAGSSKTELLATIPDDARPPSGPDTSALGLHSFSPSGALEFVFGERGGVAYAVGQGENVQIVHNGRAGKAYAAVGAIALSPDGRRCAYGALTGGKWRMVVDGVEGRGFDTVKDPVFSRDGAHVAYQAMGGERWYLVVDAAVSEGTGTRYLQHAFSGDATRIAFIDDVDGHERGRLVVSDLAFRRSATVARGVIILHTSDAGSRAVGIAAGDGQQVVLTLDLARPEIVARGRTFDAVQDVSLGADGANVAYVGERGGKRFVVLNDREVPMPAGDLVGPLALRPGSPAVGALMVSGGVVFLREFFGEGGLREGLYEEAEGLVYSDDGRSHAYAARRGERWFLVLNGKEGPPFDRVVTPRFSPDGTRVAYRARQDGRRFVVVASPGGRVVTQHAGYEQVFPAQFTADGKFVTYGVKDRQQLAWKVEEP
jgi:hypothetical protein